MRGIVQSRKLPPFSPGKLDATNGYQGRKAVELGSPQYVWMPVVRVPVGSMGASMGSARDGGPGTDWDRP